MRFKSILIIVLSVVLFFGGCTHPIKPIIQNLNTPKPPTEELKIVSVNANDGLTNVGKIKLETKLARTEINEPPKLQLRFDNIDKYSDDMAKELTIIVQSVTTANAKLQDMVDQSENQNDVINGLRDQIVDRDEKITKLESSLAEKMTWIFVTGIVGGIIGIVVGVFLTLQGNVKLGPSLAIIGGLLAGLSWGFQEWGGVIGIVTLILTAIFLLFTLYSKRKHLYETVSGLESAKADLPVEAVNVLKKYLHAAQSPDTEKEIKRLQTFNNNTAASITKNV